MGASLIFACVTVAAIGVAAGAIAAWIVTRLDG
jgi:hypothetical protein